MRTAIGLLVVALACTTPAWAQRAGGSQHSFKGGHIPSRGPSPIRDQHRGDAGSVRERPFVDTHGGWFGHDSGRFDPHYHLDHPWVATPVPSSASDRYRERTPILSYGVSMAESISNTRVATSERGSNERIRERKEINVRLGASQREVRVRSDPT
jgi:hypothetical protein